MEIRGIKKGDKSLRHFTFNDEEYEIRGGVYFYKVNYGKNPLEGAYAEEEIGYIPCDKVIPLGGKKPRPLPNQVVTQEQDCVPPTVKDVDEEPQPAKKRGRPAKVKAETIAVPVSSGKSLFEYCVIELKITNMKDLQTELNRYGEKGWELCCYDVDKSLFSNTHIRAIFKRRL